MNAQLAVTPFEAYPNARLVAAFIAALDETKEYGYGDTFLEQEARSAWHYLYTNYPPELIGAHDAAVQDLAENNLDTILNERAVAALIARDFISQRDLELLAERPFPEIALCDLLKACAV